MDLSDSGGAVRYFGSKLNVGDKVWIFDKKSPRVYDLGTILNAVEDLDQVYVRRDHDEHESFTKNIYEADLEFGESGHPDMTGMKVINEPQILENLRIRSESKHPYTYMGAVLLAVNPLVKIASGLTPGDSSVHLQPHPYGLAELAYRQMLFTLSRPGENAEVPPDQTIVVSGESGAGKTVSSKMVLMHIVRRSGGGEELTKAMLGSNPVLEAFGNARTLRNPNSSRFGKMMKVHFDAVGKKIIGASIVTYLLERSRITSHEPGERNFHVFYELLAGADTETLDALHLEKGKAYQFLVPRSSRGDPAAKLMSYDEDVENFSELIQCLQDIGFEGESLLRLWRVVAAVIHLGNVKIEEKEVNKYRQAQFVQGEDGERTPQQNVAELLGIDEKLLEETLCTRDIGTDEVIRTRLSEVDAKKNLDGVVKALYNNSFRFIVDKINDTIRATLSDEDPVMGVLDIFGFETFAKNDFEQLLINYTNEALQKVFNKQVLEREAEIYAREQLSLTLEDKKALDPSIVYDKNNAACIELFQGTSTAKGKKKLGIFAMIHDEGREINPSDSKLLKRLHKAFGGKRDGVPKYPQFGAVNKVKMQEQFSIVHYAGTVYYTVGSFIEKNNDLLPKAVNEMFDSSSLDFVKHIWEFGKSVEKNSRNPPSIVSRFAGQMTDLAESLNNTQCSFIRCIKPNSRLKLGKGWFNRAYIVRQLKHLSIPKTAEILKCGLPTRIYYAQLVEQYKEIISREDIPSFYYKTETEDDTKAFITALFHAFKIKRSSYKLGLTRVFFRVGELDELRQVLQSADTWLAKNLSAEVLAEKDRVIKAFKQYHLKWRWRVIFARLRCSNRFIKLLKTIRHRKNLRNYSAIMIQKSFRGYVKRKKYGAILQKKREEEAELRRKEEEERERKRIEEELRKAAEEERLRKEAMEKERLRLEELERLEKERAKKANRKQQMEAYREYVAEKRKAEEENRRREREYEEAKAKKIALERKAKEERERKDLEMLAKVEAITKEKKNAKKAMTYTAPSRAPPKLVQHTLDQDRMKNIWAMAKKLEDQKSLGRKKKAIFSESDLDSDDSSEEDSDEDSDDDDTDEEESDDDSSTDEGQGGAASMYSADFQLEAHLKGALKGGSGSTSGRSEYQVYIRLDKLQRRRSRGWTSAHWVECVMWVLPAKKTILLKQTEFAGATDGPKWTCKQDEKGRLVPSATALPQHSKKQPKFAISITGLQVSYMDASYGEEREIVVAFRRQTDMSDFNRTVSGFLVRHDESGEVLEEDASMAKKLSQQLAKTGSSNLGTKRNFSRKLLSLAMRPRGNEGGEGLVDKSDKQILKMVNSAIQEEDDDAEEDDMGGDVQLFCNQCMESYNTTDLKKKKLDGMKRYQCPEGHLLEG